MDVIVDFNLVQGEARSVRWPQPVSFQVPRGQLLLIRTKSAFSAPLFRLCLGFSEPNGGTVTVQCKVPSALERNAVRDLRRTMGCTLDPDGVVANMTIRMNLVVPLVYATGLPLEEAEARADNMLNVMHIAMWSEMRPASVPVEIRQTAALARALCPRPSLLLLENPLGSVEKRETRRLLSLCRAQAETILITTPRSDGVLDEFADAVWDWNDEGFTSAPQAA